METDAIRFLVGTDGKATAVQVDLGVWRQIVAALEEAEDVALAQAALAELAAAGGDPEKAGWLRLEDVEPSWAGEGKLWELRFQGQDLKYRFIYFAHSGRRFIVLHGFCKKTKKTPIRELNIARGRIQDYLERQP
jgi:hypothetical protein